MKPTRKFSICTGPILVAKEVGYEVVQPSIVHEVSGNEVKYVHGTDMGFFHIVDSRGTVVFSCPTHQILWSKVEEGAAVEVAPLKILPAKKE